MLVVFTKFVYCAVICLSDAQLAAVWIYGNIMRFPRGMPTLRPVFSWTIPTSSLELEVWESTRHSRSPPPELDPSLCVAVTR
jgi:hypothetical protein